MRLTHLPLQMREFGYYCQTQVRDNCVARCVQSIFLLEPDYLRFSICQARLICCPDLDFTDPLIPVKNNTYRNERISFGSADGAT